MVIINSSFRKGGNSEALAEQFQKGAEEVGNKVTTIHLRDIDLQFCRGCLSCLKTAKCVLPDCVNAVLPVIQNADVLVFATPVYYYSMCGQLKTFLDRLNPLYGRNHSFKKIYLIMTAAEGDRSAMEGTIQGVEGWIDCFDGVKLSGIIYGVGADAIGTIQKTKAYADAYEMGKTI